MLCGRIWNRYYIAEQSKDHDSIERQLAHESYGPRNTFVPLTAECALIKIDIYRCEPGLQYYDSSTYNIYYEVFHTSHPIPKSHKYSVPPPETHRPDEESRIASARRMGSAPRRINTSPLSIIIPILAGCSIHLYGTQRRLSPFRRQSFTSPVRFEERSPLHHHRLSTGSAPLPSPSPPVPGHDHRGTTTIATVLPSSIEIVRDYPNHDAASAVQDHPLRDQIPAGPIAPPDEGRLDLRSGRSKGGSGRRHWCLGPALSIAVPQQGTRESPP